MRQVTTLCLSILLVGCASTPTPVKEELNYPVFSVWRVGMYKCGVSGQLDAATAAYGIAYLDNSLRGFSYDATRLQNALAGVTGEPTKEQCNMAAMTVAGWKRQVQDQNVINAANAVQQQQLVNQLNNFGKSNQVYCNTIGTQTICNKY